MGVLSARLGLEDPGLGGEIILAVTAGDKAPGSAHCLVRQTERVGTHIGDQAHSAFALNINAFVELLSDGHGAPGSHIQLPAGLLLERRGSKGGRRLPLLFLAGDRGDDKGGVLNVVENGLHLFGVFQLCFLLALAVIVGLNTPQLGSDPIQSDLQRPVFLRYKAPDLILPVYHQPSGYRLDPAGGKTPTDLLP